MNSETQPSHEPMTQSVCLGRYCFDVNQPVQLQGGQYSIDSIDIKEVNGRDAWNAWNLEHKRELARVEASAGYPTAVSPKQEVPMGAGHARLQHVYDDTLPDGVYLVELLMDRPDGGLFLRARCNQDLEKEILGDIRSFATAYAPDTGGMAEAVAPFALQRGWLNVAPRKEESAQKVLIVESTGAELSVETDYVRKAVDEPGLLQRVANLLGNRLPMGVSAKEIRSREVSLDGRAAHEVILKIKDAREETISFRLEIPGTVKDVKRPRINVEMTGKAEQYEMNLHFWETVVGSLRSIKR